METCNRDAGSSARACIRERRQGWGDGVWDPHGAICRAEPVSAVRGRVCVCR